MVENSAQDQPIKIVVIATLPLFIDWFLMEQIQAMKSVGYDVTVVCSGTDGIERLREHGFRVVPVMIPRSIQPLVLLKALLALVGLFRRGRPQLIHTHTPMAAFLAQLAGWLTGVPARITSVHGLIFAIEPRPILRWTYHMLEVLACRWATKVVSVSEEDGRHLVERCSFAPSKVEVFNVGIDLRIFRPERVTQEVRAAVRDEMAIPRDAIVFGIVSRLTRVKGVLELFEAFAALCKRHQNVYLLHVGMVDDVRGNGVTPDDAVRFGCAEKCRFAGKRTDIWRFLGAIDVFCLPSRFEGYPASLMEAAAMGLPSVATNIRGCREVIVDGSTGILVKPLAVGELEAAMERLLQNPQERREMGARAMERAAAYFDRDVVVRKTLDLYRRELRARSGIEAPEPVNHDARVTVHQIP
ncbi:MAG TPA: glycosyltransferase family 4 protein [Tepidisphaeraceae bacterium]|jgi:glycosyltransferase involved in cell wall biosynthesis